MTTVYKSNLEILLRILTGTILFGAVIISPNTVFAQPEPPPMHQSDINLNTGHHDGDGTDTHIAFTHTVNAGAAPWIQVQFGNVELGDESFVRLTSVKNGDQQELDAQMMANWNNASGVFHGGSVIVELFVGPQDTDIFVEIDVVTVGEYVKGKIVDPIETLCDGDDDRIPSNDGRVGRLFFGGCTAWLISNGAVLTAGHCFPVSGVVEFNVPPSQSDGTPVAAALQDQYPIDGAYAASWNDGDGQIGRDWGVFSIGPNSTTGLRAHRVQGFIRCTNALPNENSTLRVTGFGVDSTPPARNFTQQTDTGPFRGEDSDDDGVWLEYRVDTRGANSGSPILWNSVNRAIGIHTNGGCSSDSSSFNSGTSFELNELENFMNQFWGNNVEHVDAANSLTVPTGSVLQPWPTVGVGAAFLRAGGVLVIVEGSYDETITINKAMTIRAPVGTVTIGQ